MVNFKMIWSCENWLVGFKRSRIFYSESLWDKDRENKMFAIVSARIAYWMMWFGGGGGHYDKLLFYFFDHDDQLFKSATNQIIKHKLPKNIKLGQIWNKIY